MGEKVRLDENESKSYEQLDGKVSANGADKDIVPETTINGTFKSLIKGETNELNPIEECTETSGLLENQNVQMHKPLTFVRAIRGILCLMVLVSTAFMTLIIFAPPAFLLLRLFSVHYSRKVVSFLFGHWLATWPFLFEKINGTKVIFSGDCVPPRERVLLICNHRTEVDWMYIWNLALRKDRLGYIKYVLKSSVRNAPIFGWGFHVLEFILVERKWEVDEPVIESMLSTFKDPQDPLWLILFPEGTDFTEQKCLRSQRIAKENNLPVLKNVLLPRTKGFTSCLALLRGSLDAGDSKYVMTSLAHSRDITMYPNSIKNSVMETFYYFCSCLGAVASKTAAQEMWEGCSLTTPPPHPTILEVFWKSWSSLQVGGRIPM